MNFAMTQLIIEGRVLPKGTKISDADMALIKDKYPHFLNYVLTTA